ncbi:MAG: dihydrolipoamide acetyltransferase family protein [Planctomycetota bacterium]
MPVEITMPRLSDTMEQGTVVAWNVKEGDTVSAGDTLGDIETDKATMELQAFDDGTVAALLLTEGDTVDVGALIMVLAEEGEDAAQIKEQFASGAAASSSGSAAQASAGASNGDAAAPTPPPTPAESAPSENGAAAESSTGETGGRVFASPLARKIAEERGVNLAALSGTGPSGRIVKKDVEAAAPGGATSVDARGSGTLPPPTLPAVGAALTSQTVALSNMRATIARRLVESKTTVPHYQVTLTVDMDPLIDLRHQLNAQLEPQGVKLSVNDFIVRACALAMHEHPHVNSSWGADGKSVHLHGQVNIGVAVALPIDKETQKGGGLVVATIRDCDRIGLRQISAETRRLAKKARDKGLSIEEMADSTFAISNLGMYGVEHFTAIVNPPNTAILAVGGAMKKPVVRTDEDGEDFITVGHEMQMTMSSDHRVIDGAMAAEYLSTVKRLLEGPAALLV